MGDGGRARAKGRGVAGFDDAWVYVLSASACGSIDRLAVERYGVPSVVLMENASRHATDVALEMLERERDPAAIVFAGPGNNGGDGLAMARHLHNARVRVGVVLAAPPERYRGDAGVQLGIVSRMGVPTVDASAGGEQARRAVSGLLERVCPSGPGLVVDALLGTGISGPAREPLRGLILMVNDLPMGPGLRSAVLSVDVPSGLDADTGAPLGDAVEADATVTFVGLKPGFLTLEAQPYVGEVVVADIGAPRELVEELGKRLHAAETGRPAPRGGASSSSRRGRRGAPRSGPRD
jgi:NAD(P)H-hydrate epimerase